MKPNEQALAARRRRRNLLAALGLLALALLSFATFESYRDLEVARARATDLEGRIAASGARVEALEERVGRLREDPAAIERLAREELLMARPNEIVVVLPAAAAEEERGADG